MLGRDLTPPSHRRDFGFLLQKAGWSARQHGGRPLQKHVEDRDGQTVAYLFDLWVVTAPCKVSPFPQGDDALLTLPEAVFLAAEAQDKDIYLFCGERKEPRLLRTAEVRKRLHRRKWRGGYPVVMLNHSWTSRLGGSYDALIQRRTRQGRLPV